MLRQVPADEWVANGSEVWLCQLPWPVAAVEARQRLVFEPLNAQMLHDTHVVVAIDGQVYLLTGVRDALAGTVHSFVSVQVRGDARDPAAALGRLCAAFDIDRAALHAVASDLAPRPWLLWRQDDNGHREPMWFFKDFAFAQAMAAQYTARGHRQLYVVEPVA